MEKIRILFVHHKLVCGGAEQALFSLGFTDFRVRVFHDAARVQLKPAQMQQALTRRSEILENMRPYFETVLLDLKGR